jgi:integrase
MSVYKRGSKWWYKFTHNEENYRKSTGITVGETKEEKKESKQKALNVEKTVRRQIEADNAGDFTVKSIKKKLIKKDRPIAEAWGLFLDSSESVSSGEQTRHNKMVFKDFCDYLKDNSKVKMISDVDESVADKYITYLLNHGKYNITVNETKKLNSGEEIVIKRYTKKEKRISKSTVKKYLTALKFIFRIAFKKIELGEESNPFKSIIVKDVKRDQVEREAFTPKELVLINQMSHGHYLRNLFIGSFYTGLREGDLCQLKWDRVKFDLDLIENVKMSKTSNSVYIPLMEPFKIYLLVLSKEARTEYIFPELAAMYQSSRTRLSADITKFLEGIGIKTTITPEGRDRKVSVKDAHSLRHSFAYYAAINKVPLGIVQNILGHMTPALTQMYMAHYTIEDKMKHFKNYPTFFLEDVIDVEATGIQTIEHTDIDERLTMIKEKLNSMDHTNWWTIKDELLVGI